MLRQDDSTNVFVRIMIRDSAGPDSLAARHRRRETMMYVRPVRRFTPQEVSYLTSVTSVTTDANKRLNKA